MQHPDREVNAALIRLNDALCSWERATGRQSVLILREEGGFVCRTQSGKPGVPDDIEDSMLLNMIDGGFESENKMKPEIESVPEPKPCPWCGNTPQRFRTRPEHDGADPCGTPRVRCVAYQCPLNCIEFKPDEWNTRADFITALPDSVGVAEIRQRADRLRLTLDERLHHVATESNDNRIYENTIQDLVADIDFLLSALMCHKPKVEFI